MEYVRVYNIFWGRTLTFVRVHFGGRRRRDDFREGGRRPVSDQRPEATT